MKTRVTEHRIKHDTVLEIKARLESEIAEYRRLLEGERYEQKKWDIFTQTWSENLFTGVFILYHYLFNLFHRALIIKQVTEEVEGKNLSPSPF